MPLIKVYRRQRKLKRHYLDDSSYGFENSYRNRDHSASSRGYSRDHASRHRHSSRRNRSMSRSRHNEDSHLRDRISYPHHSYRKSKRSVALRYSLDYPEEDRSDVARYPLKRKDTQPPRSRASSQNRTQERINPAAVSPGHSPQRDVDYLDSRGVRIRDRRDTSLSVHSPRQPSRGRRNSAGSASMDDLGKRRHAAYSPGGHHGNLRSLHRSRRLSNRREPIKEIIGDSHHRRLHSRSPRHSTRDTLRAEDRSPLHYGWAGRTARSESAHHHHLFTSRRSTSRHTPHRRSRSRHHNSGRSPRHPHRNHYERDTATQPRYIIVYKDFNSLLNKDDSNSGDFRCLPNFTPSRENALDGVGSPCADRRELLGAHPPPPRGVSGEGLYGSPASTRPRPRQRDSSATMGWSSHSLERGFAAGKPSRAYDAGLRRWTGPPGPVHAMPEAPCYDPHSAVESLGQDDGPGLSTGRALLRNAEMQWKIQETKDWIARMGHEIGGEATESRHRGRLWCLPQQNSLRRTRLEDESLPLWNSKRNTAFLAESFRTQREQESKVTVSSVQQGRRLTAAPNGQHSSPDNASARGLMLTIPQVSSSTASDSMEASRHSAVQTKVEPVAVAAPSLIYPQGESKSAKLMPTASSQRQRGKGYSSELQPAMDYSLLNDPILSFSSFMDGNTFDTTTDLCEYNVKLAEALSNQELDLMREAVFKRDEVAFAELLYGDEIQYELDLINAVFQNIDDLHIKRDMYMLSLEAVKRFNKKCYRAQKALLLAGRGLPEAIGRAASRLEDELYFKEYTPSMP